MKSRRRWAAGRCQATMDKQRTHHRSATGRLLSVVLRIVQYLTSHPPGLMPDVANI